MFFRQRRKKSRTGGKMARFKGDGLIGCPLHLACHGRLAETDLAHFEDEDDDDDNDQDDEGDDDDEDQDDYDHD